jgi:hypothetical protein
MRRRFGRRSLIDPLLAAPAVWIENHPRLALSYDRGPALNPCSLSTLQFIRYTEVRELGQGHAGRCRCRQISAASATIAATRTRRPEDLESGSRWPRSGPSPSALERFAHIGE